MCSLCSKRMIFRVIIYGIPFPICMLSSGVLFHSVPGAGTHCWQRHSMVPHCLCPGYADQQHSHPWAEVDCWGTLCPEAPPLACTGTTKLSLVICPRGTTLLGRDCSSTACCHGPSPPKMCPYPCRTSGVHRDEDS